MQVDNLQRVEMEGAGAERNKMKYEYQWYTGKCLITGSPEKVNPDWCCPISM